jgi:exosome complex RNA-binding protein Csl4
MNISEINRSIIAGSFTNEELNSIGDAIKFARSQIANKNKFTLVKGSKVKFTNSRSGGIVIGTVEKVNRKFIIVREQNTSGLFSTNWRVPASMLSAA